MSRAVWVFCLIGLAACSGPTEAGEHATPPVVRSPTPEPSPPTPEPSPPTPGPTSATLGADVDSGRATIVPVVAPMRVQGLRWANGNVPRGVPEPDEYLPSLLDDAPGRALVASYVPRPNGLGFPGEAIEFYGVDGRWRRLSLGDLGLPPAGWSGYDTYGAGALSPDGRWWAGPMLSGFYLVDMRDGSVRVGDPVGRHYGQPGKSSFSWSPDSDEMVVVVRGRASRVSVPALRRRAFPRPEAYPDLRSDGGWIECPTVRRVIPTCTTYAPDGTRNAVREVPADLQGRWSGPFEELNGSVWFSVATSSYGNYRGDWEVALTDHTFRARSRLVLPRGSQIDGVGPAFGPRTLGLAAINDRLLLAYLSNTGEIVRLLRPGRLSADMGQDFWDTSFARDLMRVR